MHKIDRLAQIRQQKYELNREEQTIRADIAAGRCGTTGHDYTVTHRKQLLLRRLAGDGLISIVRDAVL